MVVPKNKDLNRDPASVFLGSIDERVDRLEQKVATFEASPAQDIEDRYIMVVEGDTCHPNLKTIPEAIDGEIIITRSEITTQLVREYAEAGITLIWMHENAFMGASASRVSQETAAYCRENGITVIEGGCPLMFLEFGHDCMRRIMDTMGRLPE